MQEIYLGKFLISFKLYKQFHIIHYSVNEISKRSVVFVAVPIMLTWRIFQTELILWHLRSYCLGLVHWLEF